MPNKSQSSHQQSRRDFLRHMGSITAGLAVSSSALGAIQTASFDKTLMFQNLHTGEALKTTFYAAGDYVTESLDNINYLLRDHRSNQVGNMDPQLLTLLHDLKNMLGSADPFHVISGYRSPETNAMLNQRSNNVAKKSLHMQGKAIDIRLPGIDTKHLHQAALALQGGGVGLYTRSDFIHLDVGRVRQWGK
ncbi:YcbK family protein [Neptunomonas sp.]|uniref:YcbK family protein n=1 Tax=Neptunomonas sp. TaxID=1971898 RepID=UPI0025FA5331|nr:YcbK family protein [Neptunomonas sp.]